jgi:hypothetical protein
MLASPTKAASFCVTYTTTANTATTALPDYIVNCQGEYTAISSACSCIVDAVTLAAPTTAATATSTRLGRMPFRGWGN